MALKRVVPSSGRHAEVTARFVEAAIRSKPFEQTHNNTEYVSDYRFRVQTMNVRNVFEIMFAFLIIFCFLYVNHSVCEVMRTYVCLSQKILFKIILA